VSDAPRPRVLVVAREPGAASALAPVARACAATVVAFDSARMVFEREGLTVAGPTSDAPASVAHAYLAEIRPDVLLTGTSRQPLAALDDAWWRAARALGIPSVALLDHWIGYAERFTLSRPFDAMPDIIAVMDDYARDRLVAVGADAARIVVSGQPALDRFVTTPFPPRAPSGERVVLFASEPLEEDVGGARGYVESDALAILLDALGDIPARPVIRPHPRESPDRLQRVLERHERAARIEAGGSAMDAIANADVVVGMTSVLLLEAALAGRHVLSIQPAGREPWTDHFQTLITTVESVEGARAWLRDDANWRPLESAARLERVRLAGFDGHAAVNLLVILSAAKDLHLSK
jgi:hypothetical protein